MENIKISHKQRSHIKIFSFLSLKLSLRPFLMGRHYQRHASCTCVHVSVSTHVQECSCVYVCAFRGSVALKPLRNLCKNSSWAHTEELYKSFPKCNSPIKHKVQTGNYSFSHQLDVHSELCSLFRYPVDTIHLKLSSLNSLDVYCANLHASPPQIF